jgi:hypothetical protein
MFKLFRSGEILPDGRTNQDEAGAMVSPIGLKFKAKSKEEIPTELQSLYVSGRAAGSCWTWRAVDKAKVEELRSSNAALLKERDELRKRFDGIDSDEAWKLFEK